MGLVRTDATVVNIPTVGSHRLAVEVILDNLLVPDFAAGRVMACVMKGNGVRGAVQKGPVRGTCKKIYEEEIKFLLLMLVWMKSSMRCSRSSMLRFRSSKR